jgi:hypothetical protein
VRWIRALVVLVAVVLAGGALVWISAFGFHDHATGVDCGVPLASALHAKEVPKFGSGGDLRLTDACVGEARKRIGIAVLVVLVSAAAGTFVVRYRRSRWNA